MQVVGYDAGVGGLDYDPAAGVTGSRGTPALLVADAGAVDRIPLDPGRVLTYRLGPRHCAGERDGDIHEACENRAAPYCDEHTDIWPCARCVGNCNLPIDACREEHAVYLAAFPPATVKVGVTRLWRLAARLCEQGAVRGAHLHTVSTGRIAREIEAEIAETHGDRVTAATKIRGLHRTVDEATWERVLAPYDIIDTFTFDDGIDLRERPVRETLAAGTVRGSCGRILVLERGGSTYAVDLRDLVGHELEPGVPDRDLQSSLGAFR